MYRIAFFSFPSLYTRIQTSRDNIQTMSSNYTQDFTQYPFSETADSMGDYPFCSPAFQPADTPSPEVFDQEWDEDEEVCKFHCSSEQMESLFYSHNNSPSIPTSSIPSSALTNSTVSSYGLSSSQYSDIPSSESGYLNLSDFEQYCPANGESQAFVRNAEFTDSTPFNPHLHPTGAHGATNFKPIFLGDNYSNTMQQPITCVNPAALSSNVILDPDAQRAQSERRFVCPHCPFSKSEHVCICSWLTRLASFFA